MAVYILATQHKVEDYDKFKELFDGSIDMRKAGGEKSYQICRNVDDPNDLVLLFEWESVESARKYIQNPKLAEAQKQAGLVGRPNIRILEGVD